MSNYTKSTNFTAKDSLPTGDTNKVIRGSEFDTEFSAIAVAVATKSDLSAPTFTGEATFADLTATGTVNFSSATVSNLGAVTTADINGGTIDGVTIGGTTPGAGTFSSLVATTADINAGTIDNAVIGGSTPAAGTFTAVAGTTGTFSGAVSGTTGTFSGAVTGSNLNIANWDTAYGWGDHSTQGYLTSVTFSDMDAGAVTTSGETFANSDTQIPTNAAVRNWVLTTYPTIVEQNNLTLNVTWANVPDANITESSVTQHQAALSISTSQLAGGLSLSDITDVTATASEVNTLDGITATATEVNYTDGVTSNIQTQLDSKVGANYTGDVDITGELLVDSYNETFKKVSSVEATVGYQLGSASYDSKSFSLTEPHSARLNNDGTKAYFLLATGSVIQYSLTTAYDISTATTDSKSFSFTTQDASPRGITLNGDGTKVYMVGYTNATVYQYSLSTAFDISTASYDSVSFSLSSQGTQPDEIIFNNDGTKFYVCMINNETVFQYSLSSAYDMSTATYDSVSLDVSGQSNNPRGIALNGDGTKFFVLGEVNDAVYQYSLGTAYSLSGASYDSVSFDVSGQVTLPTGLVFGDNGTKMYIAGYSADNVYQYTTGLNTYPTASPITVTGLTNGTSYTFNVWALNAFGWSGPSDASGSVSPAPPRGIFAGGTSASDTTTNVIQYIDISST